MDRRTNRAEGSTGASPTIVTSRAEDDDLDFDSEQETQVTDITPAPPRRANSERANGDAATTSATATTAPANGKAPVNGTASDDTTHDVVAPEDAPDTGEPARDEPVIDGTAEDSSRDEAAQDTFGDAGPDVGTADGGTAFAADDVPAFPADNLGSSRNSQSSFGSPAHDFSVFDATHSPAAADQAGSDFAGSDFAGSHLAGSDLTTSDWTPDPTATGPIATDPTVTDRAVTEPAGPDPLAVRSTSSDPEAPSVSPAAFAWDTPDPPASSAASPARSFLRAGTTAKNATASRLQAAAGGVGIGAGAGKAASAKAGPQSGKKKTSARRSARQAHLTVARVEPWSVMKFSFVVSLVAFVVLFVAVLVVYSTLSGLGVFDSLQRLVSSLTSSQGSAGVNAAKWFSASRILGYTAILGVLNIVLITAMSTIGAVVYNLTSRLVGGVEVTLRETE